MTEQEKSRWTEILEFLIDLDVPNYRHLSRDEKIVSYSQLIADLFQLSKGDGCIAAAWVLDIVESLTILRTQ